MYVNYVTVQLQNQNMKAVIKRVPGKHFENRKAF